MTFTSLVILAFGRFGFATGAFGMFVFFAWFGFARIIVLGYGFRTTAAYDGYFFIFLFRFRSRCTPGPPQDQV